VSFGIYTRLNRGADSSALGVAVQQSGKVGLQVLFVWATVCPSTPGALFRRTPVEGFGQPLDIQIVVERVSRSCGR